MLTMVQVHGGYGALLAATLFVVRFLSCTTAPAFDIANAASPLFMDPKFEGAADPHLVWDQKRKGWWIFYTQRRA